MGGCKSRADVEQQSCALTKDSLCLGERLVMRCRLDVGFLQIEGTECGVMQDREVKSVKDANRRGENAARSCGNSRRLLHNS